MRTRLEAQDNDPARRWHALADRIDPRLTSQSDWPALAAMLHEAHSSGLNVPEILAHVDTKRPLGDMPAQELRYRLVASLPEQTTSDDVRIAAGRPLGTDGIRRARNVQTTTELKPTITR